MVLKAADTYNINTYSRVERGVKKLLTNMDPSLDLLSPRLASEAAPSGPHW